MTLRLQNHHIEYREEQKDCYDDDECMTCGHIRRGEWVVPLPWFMHRPLNILQRWKATEERYAHVISWLHAITHEANRIRKELDAADEDMPSRGNKK